VIAILAAMLGAGFGLGLWLTILDARRLPRADGTSATRWGSRLARRRSPVHLAAAIAGAAVVALATRWLVAGLLAGLAVWALPGMLMGAERRRAQRLRQLEAIATWTESLVATLSGAAGLEQTITATAPTAPAPIRGPVTGLADVLRRGMRLPDALRAFATDLDDPLGDTVVAALLLASTEGAGKLAEPLGLLAAATREEVSARQRVEKSRAKAATDARMIIGTTLAMAVGLVVFNGGYLRPYDGVGGQIVLAVVGLLFAVGFRWLHTLFDQAEPERVLAFDTNTAADANAGADAVVAR